MGNFDHFELKNVKVGGVPVGFTQPTGAVHLAGDELSLEQWQELEMRINLLFFRAGHLRDPRKQKDSNATVSRFLARNAVAILERTTGLIKDAPWWLRWHCTGIVTKEG